MDDKTKEQLLEELSGKYGRKKENQDQMIQKFRNLLQYEGCFPGFLIFTLPLPYLNSLYTGYGK